MTFVRRVWPILALISVVLTIALLNGSDAVAAPDDTEELPSQPDQNQMIVAGNFDIEQWVFQGVGNAAAGKQRMQNQLKLRLAEIDTVCGLSDAQKEKLNLAARGDMKRLFDQIGAVKRRFGAIQPNDPNAVNLAWQEAQPLQIKMANVFSENGSLFSKVLDRTLTAEQSAKFREVAEERAKYRYRASVEVAVVTLEESFPMRDEQRKKLVELIYSETKPPKTFGRYNYNYVLYQLSKIPKPKLQALFDERQWKILDPQLRQHGAMGPFLIQNGILIEAGFNLEN